MKMLKLLLIGGLLLASSVHQSFSQELVSSFAVFGKVTDEIVLRIIVREVVSGDTTRFEPNLRWDGNLVSTGNGFVLVEEVVNQWRVIRIEVETNDSTTLAVTKSPRQSFVDTTAQANTTYNYVIEGVESAFASPPLTVVLPSPTPIPPVEGGALAAVATSQPNFCIDDGRPDFAEVRLRFDRGENRAWVVANSAKDIVALPDDIASFNFEGLPEDIYLIYNLSFEGSISGLAVGNPLSALAGTQDLSNALIVNALSCGPAGGTLLSRATTRFCVGDGEADNLVLELRDEAGENTAWIVTDESRRILGLPATPESVDFDGTGVGQCLVYHIGYNDGLTGLVVDANLDDLRGTFDLSNPITVNRVECATEPNAPEPEPVVTVNELVYPNPAADVINVRLDGSQEAAVVRIVQISSDQRERVFRKRFNPKREGTVQINVNQLETGTYLLIARYPATKQVERVRFLKQ